MPQRVCLGSFTTELTGHYEDRPRSDIEERLSPTGGLTQDHVLDWLNADIGGGECCKLDFGPWQSRRRCNAAGKPPPHEGVGRAPELSRLINDRPRGRLLGCYWRSRAFGGYSINYAAKLDWGNARRS